MSDWALTETVKTSAGVVSAGQTGQGPDLVLAHGWPWSSFSWHKVIPTLAQRYRVHWYDMPGYGHSEKRPDRRTSLDVQGEIFVEMLTHWRLCRPSVIAHDFGGAISLRAHLLHGCEYERYVLMNVVAVRPWGSAFFDHVGRHVEAFQGLPQHIHRAIVEAYIRGALVRPLNDSDLDRLIEPWLTEDGAHSFYRQFAQADEKYTAEIEPSFGAVRCPVKIIWGEKDPWIPLERGRQLHRYIPQAEFQTIPEAGHMPQLETPGALLDAVGKLL
ncbi:alpha/beta fold hydrolase [Ensifer sp. BR816]|uniref:alpha/beta fold hydrolase n=1 Tax=Rhizobium sp. (strain BR816) TaxID=1057002 RepID=UPI00037303A3|nr:alpha/beta hydrolase [Ensifer sp. BR816]